MSLVPILGDSETYYLNSGHLTTLDVSYTGLTEYLQRHSIPYELMAQSIGLMPFLSI